MITIPKYGPEDFRALYEANQRRVSSLLARMVGPQDAEDLTQVAFAKAAKALPTFRGEAEASTWLYRIAANVALDWLRDRSSREAKAAITPPYASDQSMRASVSDGIEVESAPSPEQELARKDMRACIRNEIGKLSENNREVFMLSALGGLNDDEIAQTLGISKGNAKVRLHRARQEFKKIVEARCDFYRNELSCKPSAPDCCAPSTSLGKSSR